MKIPPQIPDPQPDGWNYKDPPAETGMYLVTIRDRRSHTRWTAIRFCYLTGHFWRWFNGSDLELNEVIAWKRLDAPAKGHFYNGKLFDAEGAIE